MRKAKPEEVGEISALLSEYAAMGNVLPRTEDDIRRNLSEFHVIVADSTVVGCGALEVFTRELAEIRSLMIAADYTGCGLGRLLVEYLIAEARARGFRRLMALTYVPGFFHKLGFRTVSKDTLPEKVWGICVTCYKFSRCDEIAVLKNL